MTTVESMECQAMRRPKGSSDGSPPLLMSIVYEDSKILIQATFYSDLNIFQATFNDIRKILKRVFRDKDYANKKTASEDARRSGQVTVSIKTIR